MRGGGEKRGGLPGYAQNVGMLLALGNGDRLQLGELENVVDQIDQPVDLHTDHGDKTLLILRRGHHTGGEHVGKAFDGGQRSFELMRDVGGKFAADAFRFFQLGHVGDQDGRAHPLALILAAGDG